MTGRYALVVEGFSIQLLHAYIMIRGSGIMIRALDHSEMKDCCAIIISLSEREESSKQL